MVMELQYDRSLYGVEHEAGPFEISRDQIKGFSKGLGETGQVYLDESAARAEGYRDVVAPPTFCTVLVNKVKLPDINLQFGRTSMHAGQRVQYREPIVAGDSLTAFSHLKDVYAKTGRSGTMVFVVWETTFRNQDDQIVADVQESFARRE